MLLPGRDSPVSPGLLGPGRWARTGTHGRALQVGPSALAARVELAGVGSRGARLYQGQSDREACVQAAEGPEGQAEECGCHRGQHLEDPCSHEACILTGRKIAASQGS